MRKIYFFIPVLISSFLLAAHAQSFLKTLPESNIENVKSYDKSLINCADIPSALKEYNELARANETAFADFLLDVTNVMYGWHETLVPLEGSNQNIPAGTFEPIYDGTQQIDELVGMAYDNSEQLSLRLNIIMSSLQKCL